MTFYMHHPTDRITHTTAFVTPDVEHWLDREIAQWVDLMTQNTPIHEHYIVKHRLLPQSTHFIIYIQTLVS